MNDVYGLILCGGKSTRMGRDKSMLAYHGVAQYEYLYNQLSAVLPKVFLSCQANKAYPNQFPQIKDLYDIESPLNGILSAFKQNSEVAWLVVACDMPFINSAHVEKLLKNRNTEKLASCLLGTDNKPHPLFTIYEPAAYRTLQKSSYHSPSPRFFLMNNEINIIQTEDQSFLRNANTISEYQELRNEV